MKLSSLEEYGLRCILRLAEGFPSHRATVDEIAKQEGLSPAYVEKLLLQLKRSNLVMSTRGACGGYTIAKNPTEISLGAVLRAMDDTILTELCERFPGDHGECVHLRQCNIRPVWIVVAHHLFKILDQITLADLLKHEGEQGVRKELYSRFPVSETLKVL